MPIFELVNSSGEVFPIEGEFVLGRGSGTALKLDDVEASRRHATLYIQAGILMVRDEASANGTFVNGQRIYQPAALSGRDELRIGNTRFTIRVSDVEDVIPTVLAPGAMPATPAEAAGFPPQVVETKKKSRLPLIAIGCVVLAVVAICGVVSILLLGRSGSVQNLLAGIDDIFGSSQELNYAIDEVLQEVTNDDRPGVVSYLGLPDAFTISSIMVEGVPVRVETWRYYGFGTRVDFIDGEATWTMDIEPAPEDSIMPAWYDPLAFELGMSESEIAFLAASASPAGMTPEAIDLSEGGEDLVGGIMLVGDQILIGLDASGVVYIETIALFPGEEGG